MQNGRYRILLLNTLAFTVCFAAWTMNGVLVTFLVDRGIMVWDKAQIGWLIGIPVLTGAVMRLPLGMLTDRYGGRIVFTLLMLAAAVPMYFVSQASTFLQFLLLGLGFGLSGASFAVGVAYTALWFPRERQGTALGVFGVGNTGTALTSLGAPALLEWFTRGGANNEGWRVLPQVYAGALVVMAMLFYLLTTAKKVEAAPALSLAQRLAPLKYMRVWRFGLHYFTVFGGFVALSQWLVPYYVNAYATSVAAAGALAAAYSLPSGLVRAVGGWLADRFGARPVLMTVFAVCSLCFLMLCIPRMDIESPGQGLMAGRAGRVTAVRADAVEVDGVAYRMQQRPADDPHRRDEMLVLPTVTFWQEPAVAVGQQVEKRQLLARGTTHIFFQANAVIFTVVLFIAALAMGVGMAAVYKFIPEYYPDRVGVVGGIVGVLGGLGGFVGPILFGYLLQATGVWTSTWMLFLLLTLVCLTWMLWAVRHRGRRGASVAVASPVAEARSLG